MLLKSVPVVAGYSDRQVRQARSGRQGQAGRQACKQGSQCNGQSGYPRGWRLECLPGHKYVHLGLEELSLGLLPGLRNREEGPAGSRQDEEGREKRQGIGKSSQAAEAQRS